jgi:hypothetical protein
VHVPIIVLAAAMAGFGVPVTQGSDAYDGCAFISAADVEAITGEKPRGRPRPVRRTLMDVENYGCTYRGENFTVEVRLETGRSKEGLDMYLTALGATPRRNKASTMAAVSGIGDRAWWGPVNPTNGILHIVRGTDVFWVQTYGKASGAGSLEKTRAIADKAFAQYLKVRK